MGSNGISSLVGHSYGFSWLSSGSMSSMTVAETDHLLMYHPSKPGPPPELETGSVCESYTIACSGLPTGCVTILVVLNGCERWTWPEAMTFRIAVTSCSA